MMKETAMAIYVVPTNSTSHHENVLRTLCHLVNSESEAGVVFIFDVPRQRYAVLVHEGCLPVMSGDLTLAIYNDMKLSQYIIEDDNLTTSGRRCFRLTDRGRHIAARSGVA